MDIEPSSPVAVRARPLKDQIELYFIGGDGILYHVCLSDMTNVGFSFSNRAY